MSEQTSSSKGGIVDVLHSAKMHLVNFKYIFLINTGFIIPSVSSKRSDPGCRQNSVSTKLYIILSEMFHSFKIYILHSVPITYYFWKYIVLPKLKIQHCIQVIRPKLFEDFGGPIQRWITCGWINRCWLYMTTHAVWGMQTRHFQDFFSGNLLTHFVLNYVWWSVVEVITLVALGFSEIGRKQN